MLRRVLTWHDEPLGTLEIDADQAGRFLAVFSGMVSQDRNVALGFPLDTVGFFATIDLSAPTLCVRSFRDQNRLHFVDRFARGRASFDGSCIRGHLRFDGTRALGHLDFHGSWVRGCLDFDGTRVLGNLDFYGSWAYGHLDFDGPLDETWARLDGAGVLEFDGPGARGRLNFKAPQVDGYDPPAAYLGPLPWDEVVEFFHIWMPRGLLYLNTGSILSMEFAQVENHEFEPRPPNQASKWDEITGTHAAPWLPREDSTPTNAPSDEPVTIGARAPRSAWPGQEFTARLVAYHPALFRAARKALKQRKAKYYESLANTNWRKGVTVRVELTGQRLQVSPTSQEFIWNGRFQSVDFDVLVQGNAGKATATRLKFDVYISDAEFNQILIARPRLDITIRPTQGWLSKFLNPRIQFRSQTAFQTAFASYDKSDAETVLTRIDAIQQHAGIKFFYECLSCDPRETRKPFLRQQISTSDLFMLFWSKRSAQSKAVEWEWETAYQIKGSEAMEVQKLEPGPEPPLPVELQPLSGRADCQNLEAVRQAITVRENSEIFDSSSSHSTRETMNMHEAADVAILTALPMELDAVLRRTGDWSQHSGQDGRVYYTTLKAGRRIVAASAIGMGQYGAALLTQAIVKSFAPEHVLLVGIAGGLGDSLLGDIVISDQIVDYELQKVTDTKEDIRWSVYRSDPRLLNAALNFRDEQWRTTIGVQQPSDEAEANPTCRVGVVLSGNKVIASAEAAGALRSVWSRAAAIEMEAAGVAAALYQAAKQVGLLMIKGICDKADANKNDSWQAYAAEAAASFAWAFLDVIPMKGKSDHQVVRERERNISIPKSVNLDWRGLRFTLAESFTIEELKVLTFDLEVDWDELPGQTKSLKIVELVRYLRRRNQLSRLVTLVNEERDGILAAYVQSVR